MMNIISKIQDIKPEKVFLIIALIYGLTFLIFTPFMVPDESPHFYKALDISAGHLTITKLDGTSGIYIPESALTTFNNFSIDSLSQWLYFPLNSNDKIFYDISGIAVASYSPIPYLASGLAISIGKLFNLSALALLYMGRLANLLVWILLSYLAIKITPVHKWVLLLIALMPMTLFEAASLSADSFTIAISLLTVALFFKLSFENDNTKITNSDKYLLLILMSLVSLSKPTYIILIFLFFMIPKNKFENEHKRFLSFFLLFSVSLIVTLIWNFVNSGIYMPNHVLGVSFSGQIAYVLNNPINYIFIMLSAYLNNINFHLTMLIGNFAIVPLANPLPNWIVYSYTIVLVLVSLLDKKKLDITLIQKFISLVTFFLTMAAITAIIYISWNPLSQNYIEGIQSRYFIPIMPLLLLLFYNNKLNYDLKRLKFIIIIFILISLSAALFLII